MKRSILLLIFLSFSIFSYSQEKERTNSFDVYPNPAFEYINIKFSDDSAIDRESISIHSLIGNKVNTTIENSEENIIRISLRELNSGYYFLSVTNKSNNRRELVKFLKIN